MWFDFDDPEERYLFFDTLNHTRQFYIEILAPIYGLANRLLALFTDWQFAWGDWQKERAE